MRPFEVDQSDPAPAAAKDLVRRGYDEVSLAYRADDADPGRYGAWVQTLLTRLPAAPADVLDLGCGCGVPVSRLLTEAGHTVTGVDFSPVQIRRARQLVPAASFHCADASTVTFERGAFDAVVCLYTLIHVPLEEQPALLARITGWLRPGGWLLTTVGQEAWTGGEEGWLGTEAPMWWSHADAATYRAWLAQAGLEVVEQTVVEDNPGEHALFWARHP